MWLGKVKGQMKWKQMENKKAPILYHNVLILSYQIRFLKSHKLNV